MNTLPEEVIRDQVLPYLLYDDQKQLVNCSASFYKRFMKTVRTFSLKEGEVLRYEQDEEFLRKFNSFLRDSKPSLDLRDALDLMRRVFTLRDLFSVQLGNITLINEPWPELNAGVKIEITAKDRLVAYESTLSYLEYLVQMCELHLIESIRMRTWTNSLPSLPYFPYIKTLELTTAKMGICLPPFYRSHLQKIVLSDCENLDVSGLGHIPDVTILRCQRMTGITHFTHNKRLHLQSSLFEGNCTLSTITTEKLFIYSSNITFNLSSNPQLRVLKLFSSNSPSDLSTIPTSSYPSPNLRRCSLGSHSLMLLDWKALIPQLIELTLSYSESVVSLTGLGLETIPILTLSCLQALTQLNGLERSSTRRIQKVTIRYCDQIQDFSPLQSIDIVSIDYCQGFRDFQQVHTVKDLRVSYLNRIANIQSLVLNERRIERLTLVGRSEGSYQFSEIATIPQLILQSLDVVDALERFVEVGGRFENERMTVYIKNRHGLKSLYEKYSLLSSFYHYRGEEEYYDEAEKLYRITLIRK